MARTLVRRLLKIAFFVLVMFAVARTLGSPEIYINHKVGLWVAQTISGDVNAESMYDAYFYVDIICIVGITTVIYLITMKLSRKIRSK